MRSIFLTVTFSCLSYFLCAQIPVGHYIDTQGMPIVGYFDPMEYRNENSIHHNEISNGFEKGYYYKKSGEKVSGLIQLKANKFLFKDHDFDPTGDRIFPDDVSGLVIAQDSFFVSHNFVIRAGLFPKSYEANKPQYLKYLTCFDSVEYALFIDVGAYVIEKHYLMKKIGAQSWTNLPTDKATLELFGKTGSWIDWLDGEERGQREIFKNAEYFHKFDKKEKIFFDDWWNQVEKESTAKYNATITRSDSIWELNYYEGETLLNTSQYKSVFPLEREGKSIWFYSNGKERKTSFYEQGELKQVDEFYENGQLHYRYTCQKKTDSYGNQYVEIKFEQVYDEDGTSLLDIDGNGKEKVYDEIRDVTINRQFVENKLWLSYYENRNGNKIYQWTDRPVSFAKLQRKWDAYDAYEFRYAKDKNANGTKIQLITVDEKGKFEKSRSISKIGAGVDNEVNSFFLRMKMFNVRTKRMKVNGEKVKYEIAIPFQFAITRFYKEPANYYWMNDHMMWQRQMMQQSFQNFTPPTPPSFPSF